MASEAFVDQETCKEQDSQAFAQLCEQQALRELYDAIREWRAAGKPRKR